MQNPSSALPGIEAAEAVEIVAVEAVDVRFPTSRRLDGSDAMNPDPDYSAAYAILRTNVDGLAGHGFTFTIGCGNELCAAAIASLAPLVAGSRVEDVIADTGRFSRGLTWADQLRWLGPEKGVIHLACAAIVNAVWDLWAKLAERPLWGLLADLPPQELVRAADFRYLTDVLTPTQALEILERAQAGRAERIADLEQRGYPAYATSPGWLGYDDEKLRVLCRRAVDDGWRHVKLKVGRTLDDDLRRCELAREELGDATRLMLDANQTWDVEEAISAMAELKRFDPWWIEEPTSPDDVLGHAAIARAVAPIAVATGEHVHNRVMFKQFFETDAIGICQPDACRLAGINEVLSVLLLAAKFGVPVCPHAGGVGLCELAQHVSVFDAVAVSGGTDGRVLEYVDHLHEHFVDPVVVADGRYRLPSRPGASTEMKDESRLRHRYPDGPIWSRNRN